MQLRVAWSDVDDRSTILIAVRNPPPPPTLPDDPLGVLTGWCGPDQILVLTSDADDRVVQATGDPAVLGFDRRDRILGMTSDELVASLSERFGPPNLQPGPSGRTADSVVTFGNDPSIESPTLRVMVDRSEHASVVFIGRRNRFASGGAR